VAAVNDLFLRCAVGRSKSAAMTAELVRSGNVWDKAAMRAASRHSASAIRNAGTPGSVTSAPWSSRGGWISLSGHHPNR
jgi:hypothetical protein